MTPDTTSDVTPEPIETEIRRVLLAEALACEPPEDLADRTVARALDPAVLVPRGRPGRMPLLLSVGAGAAAVVLLFFLVGRAVTGPYDVPRTASPQLGTDTLTAEGTPRSTAGRAPVTTIPAPSAAAGSETSAAAGSETTAGPESSGTTSGPDPSPLTGPSITRTANLEVRVEKGRFDERWRQAEAVASRFGGFVTASSAQEVEGRLARGNLTLRVPADKLQGVLDELRGLGTPVGLNSSATDVSGQIVDYDARLRVAQANEADLLDLARQARTVEDNLAIRPRLQDARREIETLQARRASLQGRVDLATVTASLYEKEVGPVEPRKEGRVGQAWSRAGDAASATLAGMIIAAGYLGPFAVLAAAAWALVAAVRRRRFI